ncbi:MAG: hypothetical protein IJ860_04550 [Eubacterium sp.]|nr:hypothetical protein [Eubacterium sp.]
MADLLYYAFENTAQFMLVNESRPFAVLAVLMAIAVWKLNKEAFPRVLGAIPAFIALATGVLTPLYTAWFPHTVYLFENEVSARNFVNIQPYIGTACAIWVIWNVVINFYLIYGADWKSFVFPLIFLAGVGSNAAILYFYPALALTLRPAIGMFGCFAVLCLILIRLLYDILSKKEKKWLLTVIAVIILLVSAKLVLKLLKYIGVI